MSSPVNKRKLGDAVRLHSQKVCRPVFFPAIKVEYNEKHFFLSVIPGKQLFRLAKVSRAEEDPDKGYQRLLNEKRAKKIAEYYNEGNLIPGSVILSAQPEAKLSYSPDEGQITFLPIPGAFLVIDGQHRLYGAHEAAVSVHIPVCVFEGLDREEEVRYFLDVNGNQIGVPRTLQLEIVKFTVPAESDEALRVRLFQELNTNPESPLCNKMSPSKSVVGKLSHVPFKSAIDPLFRNPAFRRADFDTKCRLLINFLTAVESVLEESTGSAAKLTNAAFFQSLFIAFEAIMNQTRLAHGDLKESSFRQTVTSLANIDWDKHGGTNKAAIQEMSRHILGLVLPTQDLSRDVL